MNMIEIIEGVNSAIETVKSLSTLNEKIKDADVKMLQWEFASIMSSHAIGCNCGKQRKC